MQLGMVGLGRMGANLVRRLMRDGHDCVVYDVSADVVSALAGEGATGSAQPRGVRLQARQAPRRLGHGPGRVHGRDRRQAGRPAWTTATSSSTAATRYYRDDIDRAAALEPKGIHYVDVGTSGGVFGLDRGFCLMIGGEDEAVAAPRPDLPDHRPRRRRAPSARPGTTGEPSPAENGYLHCGPHGAGHFVKMVHNGIEYGLMAAYAEGLNILKHAERRPAAAGERRRDHAAARARSTTSTRSTPPTSPRCGAAAA